MGGCIEYAFPDGMRTRALRRVQEDGSPSDRLALGQSVTSVSALLTDKTTPGYDYTTTTVSICRGGWRWFVEAVLPGAPTTPSLQIKGL